MFVIRVKLKVPPDFEHAPDVDCRITPLAILTLVKELHSGIRRRVIGGDREPFFDLEQVPIASGEFAALPVQVCTIPV